MLQHGLLPKQQWEGKLYKRIMTLKQRPAQSIGDYLAHFATLERQLEQEIPDWVARMIIMTTVHPYLEESLRLRDRLGKTRADLEESLRSIKGVEKPPPGITVKESYRLGQGDSAPAKPTTMTAPRTRQIFIPGQTRKREQERTARAPTPATRRPLNRLQKDRSPLDPSSATNVASWDTCPGTARRNNTVAATTPAKSGKGVGLVRV